MFISTEWDTQKKMAELTNEKIGPQALDGEWMPLFDATHFFQSKNKGAHPGNGISVIVIEFDKDGKVTSPHTFGKPLHGRIGNARIGLASVDQPVAVTLASGDPGVDPQFDFGWWFLGLSDASIHSAPSICSGTHMSSFYDLIDSSYLYGPALHISIEFATVGCREWAYQIKKYGRPYIDVTSYIPKPCYRKGLEHYIHETMGGRVSGITNPSSASTKMTGIAFTIAHAATGPALFATLKPGLTETAGRHTSHRHGCRSSPIRRPSSVITLESELRKLASAARTTIQSTHLQITVGS